MHNTALLEKGIVAYAIVGVAAGAILSRASPDFFRNVYVVEDGFTEWSTVLALFVAFVVCVVRLVKLWGAKPWRFRIMTGLLALFCFFGAGEELSWGQRIF